MIKKKSNRGEISKYPPSPRKLRSQLPLPSSDAKWITQEFIDSVDSPEALEYLRQTQELGEKWYNPKNRKSLRNRKFGDVDNMDENIKEWKMRQYLKDNEIPPIKLRKKQRDKPKPKRCSCKKK
jgi:hypothetical protein